MLLELRVPTEVSLWHYWPRFSTMEVFGCLISLRWGSLTRLTRSLVTATTSHGVLSLTSFPAPVVSL